MCHPLRIITLSDNEDHLTCQRDELFHNKNTQGPLSDKPTGTRQKTVLGKIFLYYSQTQHSDTGLSRSLEVYKGLMKVRGQIDKKTREKWGIG